MTSWQDGGVAEMADKCAKSFFVSGRNVTPLFLSKYFNILKCYIKVKKLSKPFILLRNSRFSVKLYRSLAIYGANFLL